MTERIISRSGVQRHSAHCTDRRHHCENSVQHEPFTITFEYKEPLFMRAMILTVALAALLLVGCGTTSTKATTHAPVARATVLAAAIKTFTVGLSGKNEVPSTNLPGTGIATITVDPDKGEICYKLQVLNIKLPATEAHIHQGAVGVDGPVVVHLMAPDDKGHSAGCVPVAPIIITDILQHPENYYVNVHNAERPNGILRGQLA